PFIFDDSTRTCAPSGEIETLLRNSILNRSSGAIGAAIAGAAQPMIKQQVARNLRVTFISGASARVSRCLVRSSAPSGFYSFLRKVASMKPQLLRRLNTFDLALICIGTVVGSGIFRTPAAVAQRAHLSTLVLVCWVAGGAIALIGAFIFAELAARRP